MAILVFYYLISKLFRVFREDHNTYQRPSGGDSIHGKII